MPFANVRQATPAIRTFFAVSENVFWALNSVCNENFISDQTSPFRTDFPKADLLVSCLSDGVQAEIHIADPGFNGVLYVKGHSKDERCRKVVTLPSYSSFYTELFKVQFGNCGLIHVNVRI